MFNTYFELAGESIAFVVAEITLKMAVMIFSVANITFVVAGIVFKVTVMTSSVAKITFAMSEITF